MSKNIASQVLSIIGPGSMAIAGATDLSLLTELLLSGCDAWAVSEQRLSHPRALTIGDARVLDVDTVIYEIAVGAARMPEILTTSRTKNLVFYGNSISRPAIDNLLFASGWRRHPGGMQAHQYAQLTDDTFLPLSFYQRIPEAASQRWPVSSLLAERNLHMDMLRESGPRADAHLVRYSLAALHVRSGDRVLDCACGLGYGTAILASLSQGGSFLGVDIAQSSIDYAAANYALPSVSFMAGDAADLSEIADNSIDVVVSFETIEHVEDWHKCLAAFARVLRPDGRIIASVPDMWVDETGRDPNPYHFHAFDWKTFSEGLAQHFILEKRFAQVAPGGFKLTGSPRVLAQVPLDWPESAEWLLAVGHGNPFKPAAKESFTHPAFDASLQAGGGNLADFGPHYDNPYLYRTLIQLGERLDHAEKLHLLATYVAGNSRKGSADQGAAICVLGYRALEQREVVPAQTCIDQIIAYQSATDSNSANPHVLRWRLSLLYLAARLSEMLGDLEASLRFLKLALTIDWRLFSPLLATKTVAACFHAGILSLTAQDKDAAREYFKRGIEESLAAARSDAREILGDIDEPLPFGLQELAEVIDMGSQCALALAHLAIWESNRGAFWRKVDIRRFGMATWARELDRANAQLSERLHQEQAKAEQATNRCAALEALTKQLVQLNGDLIADKSVAASPSAEKHSGNALASS